jgi:hypothetical protein
VSPLNDPALAFIAGWAACVLFIAAWEWIGGIIEQSRPHSVSERDSNRCPWPVNDEAERAVSFSEYRPSHSKGDTA